MNNVRIADTIIYFVWAYQGAIMLNSDLDEINQKVIIHISIPSNSFLRDRNNQEMSSDTLKKYVKEVADGVAVSMKYNQDVDVEFIVEERQDNWTRDDASNAVKELMMRIFMGDPFEGVM